MQRKGANISLKGYDDIFSTEQSRAESQQERVQEISDFGVFNTSLLIKTPFFWHKKSSQSYHID